MAEAASKSEQYWLVKSEAEDYPISALKRDRRTQWTGVRNYQARNFLQQMQVGDMVLYYHSNGDPSALVGLARVVKEAYPDATQFDARSPYYDKTASEQKPRWYAPDLAYEDTFAHAPSLEEIRAIKGLEQLTLLQKGSRLSVHSVKPREFEILLKYVSSKR